VKEGSREVLPKKKGSERRKCEKRNREAKEGSREIYHNREVKEGSREVG